MAPTDSNERYRIWADLHGPTPSVLAAMADEVGSLAEGKQADFLAISLEDAHLLPVHDVEAALLYSASARDVRLTVVAGREIFRDGVVIGIDERAARANLEAAAQKIF